MDDKIQYELKDIIEMLKRYEVVNDHRVAFICNFVAFKNPEKVGYNEEEDIINEEGSRVFAYGTLEELRILTNETRDIIEDEADEDGFVNL